MKTKTTFTLAALGLAACLQPALAQLNIPSDGSDGVFAPTEDTVIDLSQAVTGKWDDNNSANAGKGIYDPDKWAIVFKYSSVNIPGRRDDQNNLTGVRVTFKNHPSRAPVVWLVKGDVVNSGILDLSGAPAQGSVSALIPSEPGPGGFRGGPTGPQGRGVGLGPGGGGEVGWIGRYASRYGNPQVLPLIGGSGGSNRDNNTDYSGGAAGGALLLAVGGGIEINGAINAKGGDGLITFNGSGSGGAVRIVASEVSGTGEINCLGGAATPGAGAGDDGRIRVEAHSLAASLRTFPQTIAVPPANPPVIWPPNNAPQVKIVSVDAVVAPADPTAPLATSADIGIQNDQQVEVLLETRDFPIEGDVSVRVAQKWGTAEWKKASYVSGTQTQATWKLTTPFVKGYTTLQARATAP